MEQDFTVDLLKEFDPKLQQYSGLVLVSIHNDTCDYIDNSSTGFKIAPTLFARSQPEQATRLTTCITDRYPKATGLRLVNSITIICPLIIHLMRSMAIHLPWSLKPDSLTWTGRY